MDALAKKIAFVLALVAVMLFGATVAKDDQPVADGAYRLVSAIDADYVWDIDDSAAAEGANLRLYEKNGRETQKFIFTYHADGYYTISNARSGKIVECAQSGFENGTNIWQHTYVGTDAQRWKLLYAGDGYFVLKCKYNGKVADVEESVAANGQNIQAYQYNDSPAQKFRLVKVVAGKNEGSKETYATIRPSTVFFYRGVPALFVLLAVAIVWMGYRRQQ